MDIRIANTEMAKERGGVGVGVGVGKRWPAERRPGEKGGGCGGGGAVGWLPLKDFIPLPPRPRRPYIRVSNLRATTPPFLFSFLLFLTLLLPLRARDRPSHLGV